MVLTLSPIVSICLTVWILNEQQAYYFYYFNFFKKRYKGAHSWVYKYLNIILEFTVISRNPDQWWSFIGGKSVYYMYSMVTKSWLCASSDYLHSMISIVYFNGLVEIHSAWNRCLKQWTVFSVYNKYRFIYMELNHDQITLKATVYLISAHKKGFLKIK